MLGATLNGKQGYMVTRLVAHYHRWKGIPTNSPREDVSWLWHDLTRYVPVSARLQEFLEVAGTFVQPTGMDSIDRAKATLSGKLALGIASALGIRVKVS